MRSIKATATKNDLISYSSLQLDFPRIKGATLSFQFFSGIVFVCCCFFPLKNEHGIGTPLQRKMFPVDKQIICL